MIFDWSEEKNVFLEKSRGISFEDVLLSIQRGAYTIIQHPNIEKYLHQQIYIISFEHYIYMVPFVDSIDDNTRFLKTIIPSRKMNKKYAFLHTI